MLGVAALGRGEPLQIGVELLRGLFRHMRGEYGFGVPRREPAAGIG